MKRKKKKRREKKNKQQKSKKKKKMPHKKKLPPVVSAEQLEKERKPAVTVGMGFKMSKVSSDNWKAQIFKEQQIRREWIRTHAPELEAQENESVVRHREHMQTLDQTRAGIKERELLSEGVSKEGKGRVHYLHERNKLGPIDKFPVPVTESQMLGWQAVKSEMSRTMGLTTSGQSSTKKPRSKPHNIVEQELEAGGWCQISSSSNNQNNGSSSTTAAAAAVASAGDSQ